MGKYNFELLNDFCKENDILLLAKYNNLYLQHSSKILLKCKQCLLETEKCFAYMIKTKNALCKKCITINSLQKQKKTMLNIYGVEHPSQSIIIKQKMKETFIKKYGVDNPSKTQEVKDKMKITNLKRYGVEFLVHNKEIKEKINCTNLKKYGCENPGQNDEVKNKIKNTNMIKYGVDNPAKHIDCINKMKQTNIKKYGVELPLQNSKIYDKLVKTNMEKYGVENCLQNPEILTKQQKSCYRLKEYVMPSGKIVNYQGFEHFAIYDLLNDNIHEEDIITCKTKTPVVFYYDSNNKKRRHFIDIFVPSRNLCIEVKSQYTITLNYDIILLKQNFSKELGYNYEIWVYDRKGNIVDIKK
jgi:hypothetical protein